MHGYTNTDYGQDVDDKISVGAYIFFLERTLVSWNSKKQPNTSRLSCESMYKVQSSSSMLVVTLASTP